MNLKRIIIAGNAAKQLEVLPADTRVHVEAFLENLDLHLATAPRDRLVTHLVRFADGFLWTMDGAAVFFTVDLGMRTAFIRRIEVPRS